MCAGYARHTTRNGTRSTDLAKTFRKGNIMSYEIELDGTMADIPLLVYAFGRHWRMYTDRHPEFNRGTTLKAQLDEMLSGDYDHAVEHFNGWFGADVDLISPELQREREAAEREAQDVIDKADFN